MHKIKQLAYEVQTQLQAFPCISTGIYGYPNDDACEVVVSSIVAWLEDDVNKEKVCLTYRLASQSSEKILKIQRWGEEATKYG